MRGHKTKEEACLEQQKRQKSDQIVAHAEEYHRIQFEALGLPASPHHGFELPLHYQPLQTRIRFGDYLCHDAQGSSAWFADWAASIGFQFLLETATPFDKSDGIAERWLLRLPFNF
jgi:hypothetical protein